MLEINKGINCKFNEEWDIYIVSKYFPAKYFLIAKGKKNNFTMEKPFNQVIKANLISNGANWNDTPPNRMQWEQRGIISVIRIPAKDASPESNLKETSDKPCPSPFELP